MNVAVSSADEMSAGPTTSSVRQDGPVTDPPVFEGRTDPTDWLRLAGSRAAAGRFDEALEAHRFSHRHALEAADSHFGVRLSFALSDWARLAAVFPPALEALRATRRDAADVAVSPGDPERFLEAVSIDLYLNDDAATYALIGAVEDAHPASLDDFVDHRTLDLLIGRGEYRRALRWVVDPWRSFASDVEIFGLANPGIPDHEEWRRRSFVDDTRRLLVILVGAGRADDAQRMATEAAIVLDDPDFAAAEFADARAVVASRPPV